MKYRGFAFFLTLIAGLTAMPIEAQLADKPPLKAAVERFVAQTAGTKSFQDEYGGAPNGDVTLAAVRSYDFDSDGKLEHFVIAHVFVPDAPSCCNGVYFFSIWKHKGWSAPIWHTIKATRVDCSAYSIEETGNLEKVTVRWDYTSIKSPGTTVTSKYVLGYEKGRYIFVETK